MEKGGSISGIGISFLQMHRRVAWSHEGPQHQSQTNRRRSMMRKQLGYQHPHHYSIRGGWGVHVAFVVLLLLHFFGIATAARTKKVCSGDPVSSHTVTLLEEIGSCSSWTGSALECCHICHQMYSANHISRYIPASSQSSTCCCYYQGMLEDDIGPREDSDGSIFYRIQSLGRDNVEL